ncbi:hypothetical protein EVAR_93413_1 [Eumeta japonica]|uniref:Uncharacterized protein n=1 Tax=Eumeta variegata TaxID=151549 RepID=A0A4C1UR60_EUMVA|nr:hypothetical protein EVAR_93413_1 [Eumeta japonica]
MQRLFQLSPRKPALQIFLHIHLGVRIFAVCGQMMDSVSMFRFVFCSTSFTSGGRTTTVTDALFVSSSPRAKGVGKEEKNPLWAVHAPGHTGLSDSLRLKTSRTTCVGSGVSKTL